MVDCRVASGAGGVSAEDCKACRGGWNDVGDGCQLSPVIRIVHL
jgi:hypothetical protein